MACGCGGAKKNPKDSARALPPRPRATPKPVAPMKAFTPALPRRG